MRVIPCLVATWLGALLVPAAPAVAATDGNPIRSWSVSAVDQGNGEVPAGNGSQVGGELLRTAGPLGILAFNLPLTSPYWEDLKRDRAFGAVYSNAAGSSYSALAQAPLLDPYRRGSPKGTITHLDEYQAYVKRASDASLRIKVSGMLLENVDDNNRLAAWECPAGVDCEPVRTVVRFHARAYAASAGGDFFTSGGVAYLEGHQHSWRPGAATTADSPVPLWGENSFDVDGDVDDSGTGASARMVLTEKGAAVRVPLGSVRTGELFAVHVSLEAEAVDDRGGESAAQAIIQDPQTREPGLLVTRGLQPRGAPHFDEPPARAPAPARCATRPRGAGVIELGDGSFVADESARTALVLVTRSGGSRGSASVKVSARAGSAQAGRDFTATATTVRFAAGERSPRMVEVPLREDAQVEPAETFTVALGQARCAALGSRHRATVTIVDDDRTLAPPPAAQVSEPTTSGSAALGETPPPASGLDPTFGSGGRVSTPVGGGQGEAVVIQPDGGIVTAGWRRAGAGNDFALTRHDAAGTLDRGFGSAGIATTDLGGADDEAFDAALTPDGGIVAVGRTDAAGIIRQDFGVVRYRADGTPDPGFGSGGIVKTDILGGGDQASAVAVQPDGKIVVAGSAVRNGIDSDFALVRYNADGTPDPGFGTNGIVTTNLGTSSDAARAVAIAPDGRIVVAGEAGEDIALARYTPAGQLDPAFGHGGTTVTHFASEHVANGVALTPDGEIEIAGYTLGAKIDRDFLLARYRSDGSLDGAFGDRGLVTTDLGGGDDFAEDLLVDARGRTVLVGRASSATITDLALVRYAPDGSLDPSFDGDGIVTADFHGRGEFGMDLALDAAGRIVAAGYTADGSDTEFALLRANP